MEWCIKRFKTLPRNQQSLFALFPKSDPPAGKDNCFVSAMEGARIFSQSLDAAVLLFSRVTNIPTESLVLPVISTNDRLTFRCELWDGTIIHSRIKYHIYWIYSTC